uniref:Uncharacterized protein n=1 Tax=Canis lupus dingo TaxID=286419 RepID=A0A8C0LB86_CANLU
MSGLPGAGTCPGLGETSDLKSPLGAKFREPLTEARFQQLFGDAEPERELPAEPRGSRPCGAPAAGPAAPAALAAPLPLAGLAARGCSGRSDRGHRARAAGHGFCPPDLGASSVRTLHFFLPRPHLHLVGDRETPVHRDFRGSQPDDGLGRGAAGARTPRGQPERNRERRAGRAAGWRGRGLGLRERGSDAGHVRAAARRPVHLSVRARGQGADQRGRAARARVPAAQPFGAAPPAPDRLLRALQDAGRRADRAAPEQSGRADHLGAQPGAARARQRTEREIPRQAAHPDPGGDRHGASGLCALLHLFPGHKIQRPDSGAAAWGVRESRRQPALLTLLTPNVSS